MELLAEMNGRRNRGEPPASRSPRRLFIRSWFQLRLWPALQPKHGIFGNVSPHLSVPPVSVDL